MRWITERETCGIPIRGGVYEDGGPGDGGAALQTPGGPDTNRVELILVPRPPPGSMPVDITDDTVTAFAGRLSGGAGLGGMGSVSLQYWLLWFGAA